MKTTMKCDAIMPFGVNVQIPTDHHSELISDGNFFLDQELNLIFLDTNFTK